MPFVVCTGTLSSFAFLCDEHENHSTTVARKLRSETTTGLAGAMLVFFSGLVDSTCGMGMQWLYFQELQWSSVRLDDVLSSIDVF